MPSLSVTPTPSVDEAKGTQITLSGTTPAGSTGGLTWQIFWRGRAEDGWKGHYAKLAGSVLYTKAPLPSKRCWMYVRAIDSLGVVFDGTPFEFHPKDTGTSKVFTAILHAAQNIALGEVGKQKVVAYAMLNGALGTAFVAPLRFLDEPLGSGMTLTPTLQSWNVRDYANDAAVTGQEGTYRAGFEW